MIKSLKILITKYPKKEKDKKKKIWYSTSLEIPGKIVLVHSEESSHTSSRSRYVLEPLPVQPPW